MICKTTYTYVVYHEQDDDPQDIYNAIQQAYDGGMVGATVSESTTPVDPDKLHEELVAIGNDGLFFEDVFLTPSGDDEGE